MARTVVAIYDDFTTANQAVRELVDNGYPRDNISIIANNSRGDIGYTGNTGTTARGETAAEETGTGAGVGAGIGAAIGGIGGLLVGLGALTIPGIGPVIAAGPLAVALSTLTGAGVGAVAGGVTGGLLGALIGLGIPEEEAEYYAEGVRRGGVLLTIQAEDNHTDQVMGILNHHDPIDIHQRVAQWREQGWTGYEANATPVSTSPDQEEHDMNSTTQETGGNMVKADRTDWQSVGYNADFDAENPSYRNHYNKYLSNAGYPYDYYAPAYQYGYGLARDARYKNSTWDVAAPDVERDWEREHPGTWDRFQKAIRHAWQDVSGQDDRPNGAKM